MHVVPGLSEAVFAQSLSVTVAGAWIAWWLPHLCVVSELRILKLQGVQDAKGRDSQAEAIVPFITQSHSITYTTLCSLRESQRTIHLVMGTWQSCGDGWKDTSGGHLLLWPFLENRICHILDAWIGLIVTAPHLIIPTALGDGMRLLSPFYRWENWGLQWLSHCTNK